MEVFPVSQQGGTHTAQAVCRLLWEQRGGRAPPSGCGGGEGVTWGRYSTATGGSFCRQVTPSSGGATASPAPKPAVSHPAGATALVAARMGEGRLGKLLQKRALLRFVQKYQPLGSGEPEEEVRTACASCLDLLG